MAEQIEVVEKVKRYCCHPDKDLKAIIKSSYEASTHSFCVHCGRQWQRCYPSGRWPHRLTGKEQAKMAEAILTGEEYHVGYLDHSRFKYEPFLFPWENETSVVYLPCGCSVSQEEGMVHKHRDCTEQHKPWRDD